MALEGHYRYSDFVTLEQSIMIEEQEVTVYYVWRIPVLQKKDLSKKPMRRVFMYAEYLAVWQAEPATRIVLRLPCFWRNKRPLDGEKITYGLPCMGKDSIM